MLKQQVLIDYVNDTIKEGNIQKIEKIIDFLPEIKSEEVKQSFITRIMSMKKGNLFLKLLETVQVFPRYNSMEEWINEEAKNKKMKKTKKINMDEIYSFLEN